MFAPERQERIVAHINNHGGATVYELAQHFNVTQETIRRDLGTLSRHNLLRRVHGGAVRLDRYAVAEKSLNERAQQRRTEKATIAQAALKHIPSGAVSATLSRTASLALALDAGTTTELLASHLPHHGQENTLVITHSVPIAAQLMHHENIQLELLGGRVRGLTCASVGNSVVEKLKTLRPDITFIGANGLHPRFGLSTPDPQEAAVKTALINAGRLVIALVDSSKFHEEPLMQFATLDQIDILITDTEPPPTLATALSEATVEVVVA